MKGIFDRLLIAVLAFSLCTCFVACDDNENGQTAEKATFSEIQELNIKLLEEQDYATGYFTISASGRWTVSSDRMWVTFSTVADGEYMYDVQGNADVKTVYVKVSNEARGFAESVAVVTILEDAGEQTVASITRPAKSYDFGLQAADGTSLEKISIDESGSLWVAFNSNFECGIIDYPSWMMEPVFENGGYRFNVLEESLPMEQNGKLLVGNSSDTNTYSLDVDYVGMNPRVVEISGDTPWGWIVSLDGHEFRRDKASSSDDEENKVVYGSLNMNIVCRDYSYSFLFAENVSESLYLKEGNEAWIKAVRDENDPKAVKVTVDRYEEKSSREGYLFVVPDALHNNFKEALEAGMDTIVIASAENMVDSISVYDYVLADVIQKGQGFSVVQIMDDESEVEIPCETDENADYYIKISSEYTVEDIMACNVEIGKKYTINTKLTEEDWQKNYAMSDINGEEIRASQWKYKAYLGEDGYYRIDVVVPKQSWFEDPKKPYEKDIVIRLYTPELVNIKALVLRVQ